MEYENCSILYIFIVNSLYLFYPFFQGNTIGQTSSFPFQDVLFLVIYFIILNKTCLHIISSSVIIKTKMHNSSADLIISEVSLEK